MPASQQISKVKVWWRAFRYHFVPPSIFPAVLGGLISWETKAGFLPLYFLLVLVAIIINHVRLNMTDDYFDYKYSVDKLKPGEKNPYTGGSATLSSGLLSPKNMFKAFTLCLSIYRRRRCLPYCNPWLTDLGVWVYRSFLRHLLHGSAHKLWASWFRRVLRSVSDFDFTGVSRYVALGNYVVLHDCDKRNPRH